MPIFRCASKRNTRQMRTSVLVQQQQQKWNRSQHFSTSLSCFTPICPPLQQQHIKFLLFTIVSQFFLFFFFVLQRTIVARTTPRQISHSRCSQLLPPRAQRCCSCCWRFKVSADCCSHIMLMLMQNRLSATRITTMRTLCKSKQCATVHV